MSVSKRSVDNEQKKDDMVKTQCSSLAPKIDDQKPCCSKSLALAHQGGCLVEGSGFSNSNSSERITTNESNISINPLAQPYSDTAIIEFERYSQQEELYSTATFESPHDLESESNESTEAQSNQFLQQPISRKPSQVCLTQKLNSENFSGSQRPHVSPSEGERRVERDENNNPVQWVSNSEKKYLEHASYLFHRDRRDHLAHTISLLPRSRQFVVFNVFGDFARFLGLRGRKRKKVAFPAEVIEQYQQKGDVAGKDRFVPVAKQPYRGIAPTKKRRLSAVYTSFSVKSTEFLPRVDRIEDYSKCEHFCERHCVHCECFRRKKAKPDLTNVMDGYLCDLNGASLFLQGHATRTFESAMSTLEFTSLRSQTRASATGAHFHSSYSKFQLGILSASIWIFGYSLRQMIQISNQNSESYNKTTIPSESAFRRLLEQFASMCLAVEEGVKVVLQHSNNFYHFCKECVRILKVLQIHVSFGCDIKIKLPLKRGDGLEIDQTLRKKDIIKQKAVVVMIAREAEAEDDQEKQSDLEWKKFGEVTGHEKFHALKNLLNVSLDGMNLVQTQLRFLIDDIVDSVKDVAEADLLFILADMYDRVKFLETVGNKNSTTTEMNQISRLMTEFCKDFQNFVDFGQHIIKRYTEFRDMMHLSYTFLTKGLKLEILNEMIPGETFKNKRKLKNCCGAKRRKKTVTNFKPKYDPNDFFRVSYKDAVTAHAVICANRFHIKLIAGVEPIQSIIPRKLQCSWGEMESTSPRPSLEEYVELQETDDEPPKPILISPQTTTPAVSPPGSPRGSLNDEGGSGGTLPSSSPPPQAASQPNSKSPKNSGDPKP